MWQVMGGSVGWVRGSIDCARAHSHPGFSPASSSIQSSKCAVRHAPFTTRTHLTPQRLQVATTACPLSPLRTPQTITTRRRQRRRQLGPCLGLMRCWPRCLFRGVCGIFRVSTWQGACAHRIMVCRTQTVPPHGRALRFDPISAHSTKRSINQSIELRTGTTSRLTIAGRCGVGSTRRSNARGKEVHSGAPGRSGRRVLDAAMRAKAAMGAH